MKTWSIQVQAQFTVNAKTLEDACDMAVDQAMEMDTTEWATIDLAEAELKPLASLAPGGIYVLRMARWLTDYQKDLLGRQVDRAAVTAGCKFILLDDCLELAVPVEIEASR